VLLYEVLVGALPFASQELRQSGIGELQRRIREAEPSKPSSRVSQLGDKATEAASRRKREPAVLAKRLRGDLDWITLKAMDKDRTRRYQTANALAMDIRRHRAHEPVLACPPSALYRARKFASRHRGGVVAAAVVALALLAGSIGTTTGWLRAARAELLASEEAESARQVTDFLIELFRASDPNEDQGDTITARDILDEGARRISIGLGDQPLTQARLMDAMGTVYRYLGLFDESRALLEPALESRERLLAGGSLEVAESLHSLAWLEQAQGRYVEAETLAQRSLEILESGTGEDDAKIAKGLLVLAWSLAGQAKHAEAAPYFERAVTSLGATLGPDHPDVAEGRHGLGISHWRRGDFAAAERELRQALAIYETTLGPNDYRIPETLNDLGRPSPCCNGP